MIEPKKSDSTVENAEKTALTDENPEKSAETLSQDELQAVSGGDCYKSNAKYATAKCGVIQRNADKAFCRLYILAG